MVSFEGSEIRAHSAVVPTECGTVDWHACFYVRREGVAIDEYQDGNEFVILLVRSDLTGRRVLLARVSTVVRSFPPTASAFLHP